MATVRPAVETFPGNDGIGVVFGGPSPRHDLSIVTGLEVAHALVRAARPAGGPGGVHAIYWAKNEQFFAVAPDLGPSAFLEGTPAGGRELHLVARAGGGFFATKGGLLGSREQALELGTVVICCHGGPGQDGTLQGVLDMSGLAYTGPTARTAVVCDDRLVLAALLKWAGVPCVPRERVVAGGGAPAWPGLAPNSVWEGPYVVKSRFAGAPMAAEPAPRWSDVERFLELSSPHVTRGIVAEPERRGMWRASVCLRSWPSLALSRFDWSGSPARPAEVADDVETEMADGARVIAGLVDVRGVARVDFVVEAGSGQWWVEEVDTLPPSFARDLWDASEVDFEALVLDMVDEARSRPTAQWGSSGSDESVLRSPLPPEGRPG